MLSSTRKSTIHYILRYRKGSYQGSSLSLLILFTPVSCHLAKTAHHLPTLHLFGADHRPYPSATRIDSLHLSQDSSSPGQDELYRPSSHQTAHSWCRDQCEDCCRRQTHQDSERQYPSPAYAQGMPVPGEHLPRPLFLHGTPGAPLQSCDHRAMPG